jgi:hypothetical protein
MAIAAEVLPDSNAVRGQDQNDAMAPFADGQYVELHSTIPSSCGDSIEGGTRGIIQSVDITRPDDEIYLVGFLSNGKLTGEAAWLRELDLFPA